MLHKPLLKSSIPILVILFLFLVSSYLAKVYREDLIEIISGRGMESIFAYTLITAVATIIAPLSTIPFIPIAVGIWGPFMTAVLNIVGWAIGALGAFFISRKYGRAFVEKIVTRERLESVEKRFSEKNIFWTIIFLRMTVPVDVLSYALGLFKNVTWKMYTVTLVGIIPFAFVFAYAGALSIELQILLILLIAAVLFLIWRRKD